MEIAERIRTRRTEAKLTQEELAERLGLQKSAIAKYENGRVENIKRSTIQKMASILGCSPCYLMGWSDDLPNLREAFQCSTIEQTIIINYRAADPGTQKSVRKLLDVADPAAPLHLLPVAAHAQDGATPEELARIKAYDHLIGIPGLIAAHQHGCQSPHETAEYLDVTEEFLIEAIECYRKKYGMGVRAGKYLMMFEPTFAVIEFFQS